MLEEKEFAIKNLIIEACNNKIEEFKQNTRVLNKEETKRGEEDATYNVFAGEGAPPMPYTVEASTKTLYRRLARFIRTVDCMLFQLRVTIIRNSYVNVTRSLTLAALQAHQEAPRRLRCSPRPHRHRQIRRGKAFVYADCGQGEGVPREDTSRGDQDDLFAAGTG